MNRSTTIPFTVSEALMKSEKGKTYQLRLTPEQRSEVRELTGKEAETPELSIEDLEERIAPMTALGWKKTHPQ